MSLHQISVEVILTEINCGCCGGTYAINERYRRKAEEDGSAWNCPYCKVGWGYTDNNENSRLKKELQQTKKRLEWESQAAIRAREERDHAQNQARAHKGIVTKMKKRAAAGMCPCCKRHFTQLERHMKSQHPEFSETEVTS